MRKKNPNRMYLEISTRYYHLSNKKMLNLFLKDAMSDIILILGGKLFHKWVDLYKNEL